MVGRPSPDNPEELKAWLAERLLPVMIIETVPEDYDIEDTRIAREEARELGETWVNEYS